MRNTNPTKEQLRASGGQAAIFVDYENVYSALRDRMDEQAHADELITEVLDRLRRHLDEQRRTRTAFITAYADFSAFDDEGPAIQHALYLLGAESRFVPASLQRNAVELQLCMDAAEVLHKRPDVNLFVLVTGDRAYLPLLQQFRRYGRTACVVSVETSPLANVPLGKGDLFLNALDLLEESSRRRLQHRAARSARDRAPEAAPEQEPAPARGRTGAVQHHAVTSASALRTLEIIEEHFGQYDEVYLTPLLRKLSEILGDEQDPKSIISELEEAGAVWLEKRRGFPYDYTVLLVDEEHPDVQEAVDTVYKREQLEDERPAYAEEYVNGGNRYGDEAWNA